MVGGDPSASCLIDLSTPPPLPHQKSHRKCRLHCLFCSSPLPPRITISNFRSFRQQPEIHPFSPATNAVVGRNGSGKSNLFDAVQFCLLLSPRFHTLRTVSFFWCCAGFLWTCI